MQNFAKTYKNFAKILHVFWKILHSVLEVFAKFLHNLKSFVDWGNSLKDRCLMWKITFRGVLPLGWLRVRTAGRKHGWTSVPFFCLLLVLVCSIHVPFRRASCQTTDTTWFPSPWTTWTSRPGAQGSIPQWRLTTAPTTKASRRALSEPRGVFLPCLKTSITWVNYITTQSEIVQTSLVATSHLIDAHLLMYSLHVFFLNFNRNIEVSDSGVCAGWPRGE